ncbi:hypothetical protein [Adlercreutzia equolifaciens]|uniref:hypothetical protein n=1 Tax=Adlercreutzia equolifaciens TaxID=446660 RepID=UPI0022E8034B|nr:hypothetical protein [Adlercreutzia equolifaciens]
METMQLRHVDKQSKPIMPMHLRQSCKSAETEIVAKNQAANTSEHAGRVGCLTDADYYAQ